MTPFLRALAIGATAFCLLTPAAFAEDTAAAPAEDASGATSDLSTGVSPDGPGTLYTKSTHGDWTLRCQKTEDGSDPCELYQLLKDDEGNEIAEVTLVALPPAKEGTPPEKNIAAGATIAAPLETLLTAGLSIAIDDGKAKIYPYVFCTQGGCVSRVGFLTDEIEKMKTGSNATVSVVPALAPDKPVSVTLSLKGFTEAFDAVTEANKSASAE